MSLITDLLQEIKEISYKNKNTVERVEANWDKDRSDFSEFQNRLGHLEQEFRSLKETILKQPKLIQDKVNDSVNPLQKETADLKEVIKEKEAIAMDTEKIHHRWWRWWKK